MADFSEAIWRKSTHSMANGCVEVAFVDGQVGVRDSKNRNGPILVFTAVEWEAFLAGARERQFDRPPKSEQCPTINFSCASEADRLQRKLHA